MHRRQQLHQVHAIAIRPILVRRRKHLSSCSHTVPGWSTLTTIWLFADAASPPVFIVKLYCFQSAGQRRQRRARPAPCPYRSQSGSPAPSRPPPHRPSPTPIPYTSYSAHRHAPPPAVAQPKRVRLASARSTVIFIARRQRRARPGARIPRNRSPRRCPAPPGSSSPYRSGCSETSGPAPSPHTGRRRTSS
jgi:hypothetical protein